MEDKSPEYTLRLRRIICIYPFCTCLKASFRLMRPNCHWGILLLHVGNSASSGIKYFYNQSSLNVLSAKMEFSFAQILLWTHFFFFKDGCILQLQLKLGMASLPCHRRRPFRTWKTPFGKFGMSCADLFWHTNDDAWQVGHVVGGHLLKYVIHCLTSWHVMGRNLLKYKRRRLKSMECHGRIHFDIWKTSFEMS